ncbi:MAG: DUF2807 domain-containing protein [Anaerolineae bacterium]|nr:DUF2807 domain-containing protein [Anaerolineae bacterium]
MFRKITLLILLAALGLMAGCQTFFQTTPNTVRGSGHVVTETRDVSGFSQVQINLGASLQLTHGDSEALTVEADDNLMDIIITEVRGGTLIVRTPDNTSVAPSQTIRLALTYTQLQGITVLGACDVTGEDLDLDTLSIRFAGAGSTRLSGRADHQEISISGNATLNNFDLASRSVNVEILGAGTVEVNAAETLDVRVSGLGNVRYTGDPTVTRDVTGSATITQQN